jgi:hypothetical protein
MPRALATVLLLCGLLGSLALASCDIFDLSRDSSTTPPWQTGTPDTAIPYIEGVFPGNGASGVPVDTEISFHLRDTGAGIYDASISMTVDGEDVDEVITGQPGNYLVRYRPEGGFRYGQRVSVTVSARDMAAEPNSLEHTFTFTTEMDTERPYIARMSPEDGATDVPYDIEMLFHLKDDASGVDHASIVVEVNGEAIVPSISGDSNDYTVAYRPDYGFRFAEKVSVTVAARDMATEPNFMEYDFSFSVERDGRFPPVVDDRDRIRLNIIYYGQHTPEVDDLLISVGPQYIISNTAHGLWGEAYGNETWWLLQDVGKFQEADIKVIGYLTAGYEGTGSGSGIELKWYTLEFNKQVIRNMAELDGVDGVFIDECSSYPGAASKAYLKELSDLAHSYGLIVWGNVGHDAFDEWFFSEGGFDMMNATENWRGQYLTPVQQKWGHRISVAGFDTTYTVKDAYHLTRDAWYKGLAYAYIATDGYAWIPAWIEQLAEDIRASE